MSLCQSLKSMVHDINVVLKVIEEVTEAIERERIEERYIQREMIMSKNNKFAQALAMSQGKIKYYENKLILLKEIIKEQQG